VKENIIGDKSFEFSVTIVEQSKRIIKEKREFVLSKQLLRSGTSIGANVHEAINAQSKKDFISKMYIALKEATETEYWIKLLMTTQYIEPCDGDKLLSKCIEVKKIIHSIVKTSKENLEK
jgi:four helix bundle protein